MPSTVPAGELGRSGTGDIGGGPSAGPPGPETNSVLAAALLPPRAISIMRASALLAPRHTQKVAQERSPRRTSRLGVPCREKPGVCFWPGHADPIEPHRTKGRGSGASNRVFDLGHRVSSISGQAATLASNFSIRRTVHSALGCVGPYESLLIGLLLCLSVHPSWRSRMSGAQVFNERDHGPNIAVAEGVFVGGHVGFVARHHRGGAILDHLGRVARPNGAKCARRVVRGGGRRPVGRGWRQLGWPSRFEP